jgi:hypothetical protein
MRTALTYAPWVLFCSVGIAKNAISSAAMMHSVPMTNRFLRNFMVYLLIFLGMILFPGWYTGW